MAALTRAQQLATLDQALLLLEQFYVHRQQKEAQHAVNPLQRLRLLRHQVEQSSAPVDFHREMVAIFTSLRDLHTTYVLPETQVAYLPFLVEPCWHAGAESFLVTKLIGRVQAPDFTAGTELLYWNGTPLRRAIERNGERQAGGNAAARFAQGLHALTIRPLARVLPPDEEWVTLTYRLGRAKTREARFPWRRTPIADLPATLDATSATRGIDLQAALIGSSRRHFFKGRKHVGLRTELPGVFRAYALGRYAYLRIFTFDVPNAEGFVAECQRLLERLPPDGLILDVRGNPGGNILAAEQLLQLFTPRPIQPAPLQFPNTPLVRRLCERWPNSPLPGLTLQPWLASVTQAVQTGAVHSQAFSLTSPEDANALGQCYYGPVVLITDPLCYSACDMFAAGFQDHGLGLVLGVGGATGAGGANVWPHGLLLQLLGEPLAPLPPGVGLTVAIRRSLRTGRQAGSLLEEFGVQPDAEHRMTRRDVLGHNEDLLAAATQQLKKLARTRPARVLAARRVSLQDGMVRFQLTTRRLKRVDAFVDHRPLATFTVTNGQHNVQAASPFDYPRQLRLLGYEEADSAEPVAAARARI